MMILQTLEKIGEPNYFPLELTSLLLCTIFENSEIGQNYVSPDTCTCFFAAFPDVFLHINFLLGLSLVLI